MNGGHLMEKLFVNLTHSLEFKILAQNNAFILKEIYY